MSVLECMRGDCERVMCDRYSITYGYICDQCLGELKRKPYCNVSDFMMSMVTIGKKLEHNQWVDRIDDEFEEQC